MRSGSKWAGYRSADGSSACTFVQKLNQCSVIETENSHHCSSGASQGGWPSVCCCTASSMLMVFTTSSNCSKMSGSWRWMYYAYSFRRTRQANATDLSNRKKGVPNDKKTPPAPPEPKQAVDSTDGVCGDLGSLVATNMHLIFKIKAIELLPPALKPNLAAPCRRRKPSVQVLLRWQPSLCD